MQGFLSVFAHTNAHIAHCNLALIHLQTCFLSWKFTTRPVCIQGVFSPKIYQSWVQFRFPSFCFSAVACRISATRFILLSSHHWKTQPLHVRVCVCVDKSRILVTECGAPKNTSCWKGHDRGNHWGHDPSAGTTSPCVLLWFRTQKQNCFWCDELLPENSKVANRTHSLFCDLHSVLQLSIFCAPENCTATF